MMDHLRAVGLEVRGAFCLSGDARQLEELVNMALDSSDVVICIGPSGRRDLMEALGRATGKRVEVSDEALEMVEEYFYRACREGAVDNPEISEDRKSYALALEDAYFVPNPLGPAPGQYVELEEKSLVILPSGIEEIREIMEEGLEFYLRSRTGVSYSVRVSYSVLTGDEGRIRGILRSFKEARSWLYAETRRRGDRTRVDLAIYAESPEELSRRLEEAAEGIVDAFKLHGIMLEEKVHEH